MCLISFKHLVEEKNLVRQNFIHADLGENKAKILAERYASAFGMAIEYIPDFIEDDKRLTELITPDDIRDTYVSNSAFVQGFNTADLRRNLVILIGCVDNNKSHQMCHRVFKKMQELIYIDSGNGEYTGQVVCGIRRKNRTYYKPVGDIYPDVLLDADKFPTELSCAEASVSAPQTITATSWRLPRLCPMCITCWCWGTLTFGALPIPPKRSM